MIERPCDDGALLQFERLAAESNLIHAFTTKPWNLAPHRGSHRELAVERRRRVCELLGVEFDRLTSPQQTHSAEILRVEDADIGAGRFGRPSAVPFVDGLITDRLRVPLILLSADCPLVLAFDPDRPAIGIVHASWLGTVAGITTRLVERMRIEFGSNPANLRAAVAPSAGPCCYEVGPEVLRIFRTRFPDADRFFRPKDGRCPGECAATQGRGSDDAGKRGLAVPHPKGSGGLGDRYLLDLWGANRAQLVASGVQPERIECAGLCSICDERFWSHRRDGADAGRSALVAAIVR